jgi:predicted nucleic acid-binding protein
VRRHPGNRTWRPVEADLERSDRDQSLLASGAQHRALSLVDALVAAIAESRGLTVLHYDADFELIAGAIDLEHEWVVPLGSAD